MSCIFRQLPFFFWWSKFSSINDGPLNGLYIHSPHPTASVLLHYHSREPSGVCHIRINHPKFLVDPPLSLTFLLHAFDLRDFREVEDFYKVLFTYNGSKNCHMF